MADCTGKRKIIYAIFAVAFTMMLLHVTGLWCWFPLVEKAWTKFAILFHLKAKTSNFMNKGPDGYYYDVETQKFRSASDREIALKATSALLERSGQSMSVKDLAALPDSFIIQLLEPEDQQEQDMLKKRIVIMVDPNYRKAVMAAVQARSQGSFAVAGSREIVYNLLVKYWLANGITLTRKLEDFTDKQLATALLTLSLPPTTSKN